MSVLSRENMPNAYKEVYEILKYVGEEERDAIPDDFMKTVEAKMNKDYYYIYDFTKAFEEHEMLQETKAILGYIYLNYWANEEEKRIVQNKLTNDIRVYEEEKSKNFDPKSIFQSDREKVEEYVEAKNPALIEVKESFIKRIFNKIKAFFIKK